MALQYTGLINTTLITHTQNTLTNGEDTEVDSHQGNIADGGDETWYTTTMDVVVGDWTLNVDVTQGDQVSLNNEVTITYVEGSESGINPRPV